MPSRKESKRKPSRKPSRKSSRRSRKSSSRLKNTHEAKKIHETFREPRLERETLARLERERLARGERERLAREERERLARGERERLARLEQERLARLEQETLAREERERFAVQEKSHPSNTIPKYGSGYPSIAHLYKEGSNKPVKYQIFIPNQGWMIMDTWAGDKRLLRTPS